MTSMTAKPADLVPMYASTPGPGGPGSIGGGGSLLSGGYPGRAVPPPVGTPGGGPNTTPTTGLPGPIESNMYGPSLYAAAAAAAQAYLPFTASESSAFYPHHINGDSAVEAWRNFSAAHAHHTAAAWAYDPTVISYPYGAGYGALDVRRKNATRESTSTLKAWLYEHIKNPYPTKGEKIMLAIITKMTLTQVSTWFANARRRLKKENKMQWSPRNRTGDDDDDDDDNKNIGSDLDDDVIDGRRTPRTICDDSDDIDVGVDTANDDSQSANDMPDNHRVFGQSTAGLDDRHTDDCPPHCSLLRHRLHFTNNGLLAGPQQPQHHRGFFWNSSATAASTKSYVTDDEDDDVTATRKRRHTSSSSMTSPPPPPLIAAIDFVTRRVAPSGQLSASSASLRDELDRRTALATIGSNRNNNKEESRHSKPAAEKPRIWSIADVATSGTNGRRSSSPKSEASGLPEVESAAATVTSGFQPWTSSAMVDPLSPHHPSRHHSLLNPFRVCIPPTPPSNGLQHQLRYGSFPVGVGPASASSSSSSLPAIASHQAALAHQLAAAAAIHHVRIQQQRQQQHQQQQQSSPPLVKRDSSSSSSSLHSQLSPVIGGSSRAHPAATSSSGTRSPSSNGVDDRRTATRLESKHSQLDGGTGRSISPAGDDTQDMTRKTPEAFMTSRDGSPPAGSTVASCLVPTTFKPLPPRRV